MQVKLSLTNRSPGSYLPPLGIPPVTGRWRRRGGDHDGSGRHRWTAPPVSSLSALPDPAPGTTGSLLLDVPTGRRGVLELCRCTWVHDPFGLVGAPGPSTPVVLAAVYPAPIPPDRSLTPGPASVAGMLADGRPTPAGGVGELEGIRPYVACDRLVLLHWPAMARYGTWFVRQFGGDGGAAHSIVVDDRVEFDRRAEFEREFFVASGAVDEMTRGHRSVHLTTLSGTSYSFEATEQAQASPTGPGRAAARPCAGRIPVPAATTRCGAAHDPDRGGTAGTRRGGTATVRPDRCARRAPGSDLTGGRRVNGRWPGEWGCWWRRSSAVAAGAAGDWGDARHRGDGARRIRGGGGAPPLAGTRRRPGRGGRGRQCRVVGTPRLVVPAGLRPRSRTRVAAPDPPGGPTGPGRLPPPARAHLGGHRPLRPGGRPGGGRRTCARHPVADALVGPGVGSGGVVGDLLPSTGVAAGPLVWAVAPSWSTPVAAGRTPGARPWSPGCRPGHPDAGVVGRCRVERGVTGGTEAAVAPSALSLATDLIGVERRDANVVLFRAITCVHLLAGRRTDDLRGRSVGPRPRHRGPAPRTGPSVPRHSPSGPHCSPPG